MTGDADQVAAANALQRAAQRRKATARTRLWRQRQSKGIVMMAPVPVTNEMIGNLIRLGYVLEHESEDPREIGIGIATALGKIEKL
jgi:hypothetical protein